MTKLPEHFYVRPVVDVARALLGKLLVTRFDGIVTSGIITETEAYHECEKACHAYNRRRTKRTEVLFEPGGIAYVYLCYGIHSLLNVTTGERGEAAAVLIRAIEPVEGVGVMQTRRSLTTKDHRISAGPGMLSQALGISLEHNACSMVNGQELWIESHRQPAEDEIVESPRIGVAYAGKDALLPWRFYLRHSEWVSKSR